MFRARGSQNGRPPRTTFASRPIKSAQVNVLAQMIFAPINTSVFSAWNLGPETAESSQPAFPVPSFPACYDQRTLSKGQTALVDATTISPSCSALSFHRGCPAQWVSSNLPLCPPLSIYPLSNRVVGACCAPGTVLGRQQGRISALSLASAYISLPFDSFED